MSIATPDRSPHPGLYRRHGEAFRAVGAELRRARPRTRSTSRSEPWSSAISPARAATCAPAAAISSETDAHRMCVRRVARRGGRWLPRNGRVRRVASTTRAAQNRRRSPVMRMPSRACNLVAAPNGRVRNLSYSMSRALLWRRAGAKP